MIGEATVPGAFLADLIPARTLNLLLYSKNCADVV
jgi:hypothetical protein